MSGSCAVSPVRVGGLDRPQALVLGRKRLKSLKGREGVAVVFLGLEGLAAAWGRPVTKTNPQSWVPTKLGLYKSKVGVYFCT